MKRPTTYAAVFILAISSGCAQVKKLSGTASTLQSATDAYVSTQQDADPAQHDVEISSQVVVDEQSLPRSDFHAAFSSDATLVETVAYRFDKSELPLDLPDKEDDETNEKAADADKDGDSKDDDSIRDELDLDATEVPVPPPEAVSIDMSLDGADVIDTAGYTLAEVEQMAVANHPSIAAADATTQKAAGLRHQVGLRPNPTLGYFALQLADEGTDQHGVFLEQEFVRGNKLALNQAVLSHTMTAQGWETETQRRRILTDVRVRFYEAVAAQKQLEATREFETLAKRGVDVALDRMEAEEGTKIEVLQSNTLLSEITLAAERLEIAYRGAWRDLAAIAGIPYATTAVQLIADLDRSDVVPDWELAYGEIVSQSPELAVARALVCEKAALLKRQQVQAVSNVTAQLGAGFDNGTDSGMINLQLTTPLPIWNKNSGNISAAYADYTRAVENVQRIEQSIRSRLARAAQTFDSSLATVTKYEQEIIPQATKSLELSEQAYEAGELDFLQVLVVRRGFYESKIRMIEAKGQLAQAEANIDGLLLSGGLDVSQDFTDGDGIRGHSFGGQ